MSNKNTGTKKKKKKHWQCHKLLRVILLEKIF